MHSSTIPAYVYLVKHKSTGKFYYGFRSANIRLNKHPEDDLWKVYFTSSSKIKELRIYDDNFETEIIYRDSNIDTAYWIEQQFIKENIDNPLCLNSYYIDKEQNKKIFSNSGTKFTEEHKRKISSALKGIQRPAHSTERKQQISEKLKGRPKSEETKLKLKLAHNPNSNPVGVTRSDETKIRMRESQIGKKHSPETRELMSKQRKGRQSPNKGKPVSEETKEKIRETKRKNNVNRTV